LPAHDNLWSIALKTKNDLLARIGIIQLVQEPRALDSHTRLRKKFQGTNDKDTVALVDLICNEEIQHVEIGLHWFKYLCNREAKDPISTFHEIVLMHDGIIPPPFNTSARNRAGLTEEWYIPVSKKEN